MRNSKQLLSSTPPREPACHLVMGRPDTLTAQRVEVGIVLQAMLGMTAATDYFSKHKVDAAVALRVLSPSGRRRGTHDANGIRT